MNCTMFSELLSTDIREPVLQPEQSRTVSAIVDALYRTHAVRFAP